MTSPDVTELGTRRDVALDVVRVLGLLAVIVGHVWYIPTVMLFTYSWHVPVFFVLAGYLWRDNRTLAEDLRRRIRSIVKPYVTWWVICTVFFVAWGWAVHHVIPFKFVFLAAWGGAGALRPYTAFWFFSAFFASVLFVRVLSTRGWWLACFGAAAALAFCELFEIWAFRSPMAIVAGLACSTFVLVGVGLRTVRPRLRHPLLLGAVSLGAGAGLVSLPVYRPLEIKSADFGTPGLTVVTAALLCIGLILLAESVIPRIPGFPRQAMVTVAQCATVVFLSHGIMLMLLQTPHSGRWIDFVLVATVPFLIAMLTRGSRWAPWIHGAPSRPKAA